MITYYAATIYENEIGLSPFLSRILAACNGTEYFLASWIPVFLIEKIGRRPLMLFGAVGMSLSMVVLAAATSVGGSGPGVVAAVFLFVFNTFCKFCARSPTLLRHWCHLRAIRMMGYLLTAIDVIVAIGWLGMTWLYPSEIVPLRIRAPSSALSTSANW